jgi:hypothetical protein
MLKFFVQTFYQSLFSNSPLAILLQQFFSHTKKPQSKRPQKQKAKAPLPPSGGLLYPMVNRVEQLFTGRGVTL